MKRSAVKECFNFHLKIFFFNGLNETIIAGPRYTRYNSAIHGSKAFLRMFNVDICRLLIYQTPRSWKCFWKKEIWAFCAAPALDRSELSCSNKSNSQQSFPQSPHSNIGFQISRVKLILGSQ